MFIPIFIPREIAHFNSFNVERGYQDVFIKVLKSKYEDELDSNKITLEEYINKVNKLYGRY